MRRRLAALVTVLAIAVAPVAVAEASTHSTPTVEAAEKVKLKSGPCLRLLPGSPCIRLI